MILRARSHECFISVIVGLVAWARDREAGEARRRAARATRYFGTNLRRITRPRVVAAPRERVVHRPLALVNFLAKPVNHHLEHGVDVVRGPRRHPKRVEHCQRDLCVKIKS